MESRDGSQEASRACDAEEDETGDVYEQEEDGVRQDEADTESRKEALAKRLCAVWQRGAPRLYNPRTQQQCRNSLPPPQLSLSSSSPAP